MNYTLEDLATLTAAYEDACARVEEVELFLLERLHEVFDVLPFWSFPNTTPADVEDVEVSWYDDCFLVQWDHDDGTLAGSVYCPRWWVTVEATEWHSYLALYSNKNAFAARRPWSFNDGNLDFVTMRVGVY